MDLLDYSVLIWIILTLSLSILFCSTIVKHISEKAIGNITIVDLIYRDAIVYIYLFCLTVYSAILCCILSNNDNHSVNFGTAVAFSVLILYSSFALQFHSQSVVFSDLYHSSKGQKSFNWLILVTFGIKPLADQM